MLGLLHYHLYNNSNHIWYIFLNHYSFKYSVLVFQYIHLYSSCVLIFGLENVVIKHACTQASGSLLLQSPFLPPDQWLAKATSGSPIISLLPSHTPKQLPSHNLFRHRNHNFTFRLAVKVRIPNETNLPTSSSELLSRLKIIPSLSPASTRHLFAWLCALNSLMSPGCF